MDTALKINSLKKYLGFKKDIDLADYLGVKQSTLATWKLRNTIDIDLIISKCDFVNPTWLLTGEGPILKSEKSEVTHVIPDETIVAPLISQYAYGGYMRGFADPIYIKEQPTYTARVKHNGGKYVAFEVKGDSMDDRSYRSICEGDLILGRELQKEYWTSRLHIPKVFIIVHKEEGVVIKEIVEHDVETGRILCHSWNPLPEYEDFELNLKDVF